MSVRNSENSQPLLQVCFISIWSEHVQSCPNWFKLVFFWNFRDEDEEDDDDSSVGGLNRQIRKLSSRTLEFCDSIDELSTVNKKETESSLHSGLVSLGKGWINLSYAHHYNPLLITNCSYKPRIIG